MCYFNVVGSHMRTISGSIRIMHRFGTRRLDDWRMLPTYQRECGKLAMGSFDKYVYAVAAADDDGGGGLFNDFVNHAYLMNKGT